MIKKYVIVKVREGTVKRPVKVYGKSFIKMAKVNDRKGRGRRLLKINEMFVLYCEFHVFERDEVGLGGPP